MFVSLKHKEKWKCVGHWASVPLRERGKLGTSDSRILTKYFYSHTEAPKYYYCQECLSPNILLASLLSSSRSLITLSRDDRDNDAAWHVTSSDTWHITHDGPNWGLTGNFRWDFDISAKTKTGRRCSGYIRVFWRKSLLRGLQSLQLPSLDSWQRMQIDSKLVIPLVIILIRPGLSNSKHWVLTALWDPSLASPSSLHSSLGKFGSNSKDSRVFPIRKLGGIYVFRCL